MNFIIFISVFVLTVKVLSFTAAAISYFRQKLYLRNTYQPDVRDLMAKQQGQFVY